jgi:hypothetical protein
MQNNKIILIGGCVAGLALVQGLKHRNIPFRLFERDAQTSIKGCRFRIVDAGLNAFGRNSSPFYLEADREHLPRFQSPHLSSSWMLSPEKELTSKRALTLVLTPLATVRFANYSASALRSTSIQ